MNPPLYPAVLAEIERRTAVARDRIAGTADEDQRWKRIRALNADTLLWQRIAYWFADAEGQRQDFCDRFAGVDIDLPNDAAEWRAILDTADRTAELARARCDAGQFDPAACRNLTRIAQRLNLHWHVYQLPRPTIAAQFAAKDGPSALWAA